MKSSYPHLKNVLRFLVERGRVGAIVVVPLLAAAAFPATGWHAVVVEAQNCLTCTKPCLDGSGHGFDCELNGPAKIGGNGCEVSITLLDPLGEGNGFYTCFCSYEGGLCFLAEAMAPTDREELENEAVEAVAAGRMLPADGLFYLASSAGETVVRWKCDGRVAGRLAAVEIPGRTQPVLGG